MNTHKIGIILFAISVLAVYYTLLQRQYFEYNKEQRTTKYRHPVNKTVPVVNKISSSLILNTTGCKIPIIETSNLLLSKHFRPVQPIQCANHRRPLFKSNFTSIYMVESSLVDYGLSNKLFVKCCYMWIKRMTYQIDRRKPDISSMYQNDCIFFNSSFASPYEYIKVQCYEMIEYPKWNVALSLNIPKPFYTDFFYFVKPIHVSKEPSNKITEQKFNVLVIGLDSVSRINFHRQMPKSLKVLQDLNAVEFLGFNKIADNTFPNVIAMLTGKSSAEIFESCVQERVFDKCTFIWDHYKDKGYATALAEDALNTGLFTFTYGQSKDGFLKQPTDYYWNNFYKEYDRTTGNRPVYAIKYCFNSRKVHEIFLEYVTRFVTIMDKSKQSYFGYFWQSILFHNDINQVRNGDDIYADLLNKLNNSNFLNNTVLFFMSDHGHRISTFRTTYEGMLEDRLPFLFVRLPDWMKIRYPHLQDNLKLNTKRLITMYDIFETLNHLLNTSSLSGPFENIGEKRGYSLLAPITENRTCESAAIPAEFCTCQNNEIVPVNDQVAITIAEAMVSYINNKILHGISACVNNLTLDSILYATKAKTEELSNKADGVVHEDFTIAFKTAPSQSVFEVTVRRNTHATVMESLSLVGRISRLNTYFNESLCVSDGFVKLYCYCVNLLT